MDRFVGKRIDGRYEIQEIIGVGGMAVVYKAFDNQENRIVAIKILKEEFISNEEFIRRFKNESKAIAMLSHPNIVKVFDVSFGDLIQYIVMEYIEGITLKEFIEREGSLRWKDAIYFTMQILKALQHAHDKGIVHRDVKPQNIMVLPDGSIKVTDFGIARFARSEQRTITDKAIGSVHYISPEQARGEKTDEKADIYSVGVMLYEMLTGQLPFQAESAVSVAIMQLQREPKLPTEINGSIPLGLEQITMHAMQKTCERRYQSAAEMLSDLAQFRKDPSLTFEYHYFVDNSPTKFIPEMENSDSSQVRETPVTSEPEEEEKNTMIPILAGIAVTLVLSIAILGILFVPKLFFGTTEEIDCENFIGKSITEVEGNKKYEADYKFIVERKDNPEYEKDIIFDQSKKPNEKIKKGAQTEIVLYVSTGHAEMRPVPEGLIGKSESEVVSALGEDFEIDIEYSYSEEYDTGEVIDISPKGKSELPAGSKITITVNQEKPTKYVSGGAPDVMQIKGEDAKTEIEKAKLVADIKSEYITGKLQGENFTLDSPYADIGWVFRQAPLKGSKIAEGSTLSAYTSKGVQFSILVNLPTDVPIDHYYLSLYKGKGEKGTQIQQVSLNNKAQAYTFSNIESTEIEEEYTVLISKDKDNTDKAVYEEIKIYFKAGGCEVSKSDDYKNLKDSASQTEKKDHPENEE